MSAYLSVTGLRVEFGGTAAVQDLSYSVPLGRTLAVVGESGSGKTVSSLAVLGLLDPRTARVSGSIRVDGAEIVGLGERELRRHRGAGAAMIFQDPQSSLHPYFTVGDQIAEAYRAHHRVTRRAARARAVEMLDRVGIPNPKQRADEHPHRLSGGMRQRVMIAMALVNDPKLLITYEPTSTLDVTVQVQILDLIAVLRRDAGVAVVFVTHDLGVVAEIADDILVMYAGSAVESGPAAEVLAAPQHPYTRGLLASVPTLSGGPLRPIPGTPPSLSAMPAGCSFHPRCEIRDDDLCATRRPELVARTADPSRAARCHLAGGA